MRLDRLVEELGWAGNAELCGVLEAEWESSQQDLPTDTLPFLLPEYVADACHVLSLPADAREALLAVAGRTSSDPRLCVLAWHFIIVRSVCWPCSLRSRRPDKRFAPTLASALGASAACGSTAAPLVRLLQSVGMAVKIDHGMEPIGIPKQRRENEHWICQHK